jgi:imidazolonepropionase-like amidohydrolase
MSLLAAACYPQAPATPAIPPTAPPAESSRAAAAPPSATTGPTAVLLPAHGPAQQAHFTLYKFGQRIGIEHASLATSNDGGTEVKSTFTFNDRGTDVPLAALWHLGPDGNPRRYQAFGLSARSVSIDDRVEVLGDGTAWVVQKERRPKRVHLPSAFVAASGYAPVIGQELLVRRWLTLGRPPAVRVASLGEVNVQPRGMDTFTLDGKPVTLEHLAILGLVWGREDVWIDAQGRLIALVTRDAEFDHFEALRRGHEPLIDEVLARAGADAVAWLAEQASKGRQAPGPVALVGGRLIDGTGALPVEDAVVVVDGDRIVAAGPRATTPVPASARRLDVTGQSVVPGLWDMHAHVEQVEQAAAYLAAGVTTVRDEGNILPFITAVRDAVEAGHGVGPRVIFDCLVDSDDRQALGTLRVNAVRDIAPLVALAVKAGCGAIKVYSSVKPELVRPLAAEAHRRGLKVTGHVPEGMDVQDVLDAGFDGINHVDALSTMVLPKWRAAREKMSRTERWRRLQALDASSVPMRRLFARLAARRTIYDPTVALFELFLHPEAELQRREPGLAKMPLQLRGSYGGLDPEDVAPAQRIFEAYLAAIRAMHKQGVTIVAGTDIAVPGHSLVRELELYVLAGMSPMQALQAATLVPARVLGRDRELGTISRGKRADLVVVSGNPLADIRTLRNVRLVVARGRVYQPAAMWKLAGFQP